MARIYNKFIPQELCDKLSEIKKPNFPITSMEIESEGITETQLNRLCKMKYLRSLKGKLYCFYNEDISIWALLSSLQTYNERNITIGGLSGIVLLNQTTYEADKFFDKNQIHLYLSDNYKLPACLLKEKYENMIKRTIYSKKLLYSKTVQANFKGMYPLTVFSNEICIIQLTEFTRDESSFRELFEAIKIIKTIDAKELNECILMLNQKSKRNALLYLLEKFRPEIWSQLDEETKMVCHIETKIFCCDYLNAKQGEHVPQKVKIGKYNIVIPDDIANLTF